MSLNIINNLPIPQDWEEDLNTKLKEPSINDDYSNWKVEKSFGKEIDMFALSFAPGIVGNIRVFNDETDKDNLGNYPEVPYEVIGSGEAMIRYDLNAGLKAALGFKFKNIGFDFDADQKVQVSYYSIHDNEKLLSDALNNDLTSFKFIFSKDDVKDLNTNEGLALQYLGSISTNLEISFSDAYTGTISALTQFLPEGTGIAGECKVGASVSFGLKIQDDFKAFIKKNADGSFFVTINKAAITTKSGSAGLKISAQLADNDNLKVLHNVLLDSLLAKPVDKVDDIINNKLNNLSDNEEAILNFVFNRLGWNVDISDQDRIKELYSNLKTDVIAKSEGFLTRKLELGYSFEYQQINSKNTLFEATMSQAAIENGLRNIIMFQPSKLEGMDGVVVTKYLLERTKEITKKFGFALQFGDFSASWHKLSSYKEECTDNLLANKKSYAVSFKREHAYKGVNDRKWFIALNAAMDEAQETPRMDDFDFDFALHWEDRQKKTNLFELKQFVDMAVTWKCIPEKDFDNVVDELSTIALNNEKVKFSCHLNIPSGEMDKMFAGIANADNAIKSDSLSEAVPYNDYNFRKTPSLRKRAYNSVWSYYLKDKPISQEVKHYAKICHEKIGSLDIALGNWESQYYKGQTTRDKGYISFVGTIEFFSVFQIISSIQKGAANIDLLLSRNKSYSFKKLKNSFKKIDDIFKFKGAKDNYFHLNFFARYLINIAQTLGVADEIETVATVEYEDGSNQVKKLIYSSCK